MRIDNTCNADILFELAYESAGRRHTARLFGRKANFWRDLFPQDMAERLIGLAAGQSVTLDLLPGSDLPTRNPAQILSLPRAAFAPKPVNGRTLAPQPGRFYPQGVLQGLPGVYPSTRTPFRCLDVTADTIVCDRNHPLAGSPASLTATVVDVRPKPCETGGSLHVWIEEILDGPGIETRLPDRDAAFLAENGDLSRTDDAPDAAFYRQPRLISHIDAKARERLTACYADSLRPGDSVLDLMTSHLSHLPPDIPLASVAGLGLSAAELDANPALTSRTVHDLNADPTLPCPDAAATVVLCAMSIEYLTNPAAVLAEASRVLAPGGRLIVSFSNRWFPQKVVRLWTELHEFERLGFVAALIEQTPGLGSVATLAERGWPRPADAKDRHWPLYQQSDPLFVVTARRV
jgi:SAM-dependent methyltransferase/FKBP-type peptidyl-prolyl cis-trans isomerase 2